MALKPLSPQVGYGPQAFKPSGFKPIAYGPQAFKPSGFKRVGHGLQAFKRPALKPLSLRPSSL